MARFASTKSNVKKSSLERKLQIKKLQMQVIKLKLNEIKRQRRDMESVVDSGDEEEGNSSDEADNSSDEEGNSSDEADNSSDEEGNSSDEADNSSDDDEDYIADTDIDEVEQNNRPKRKRKSVVHYIDEQQSLSEGKFHGWTDQWDRSYNGHFSCDVCGQLYDRKETRECGCDIIHWRYGPSGREFEEERIDDRKYSNSKKPKSSGYAKDGFVV